MKPYSADLRERIFKDCDGGMKTRAVARKYAVSESWVRRLKQVRRETGRVTPLGHRGGPSGSVTPSAGPRTPPSPSTAAASRCPCPARPWPGR